MVLRDSSKSSQNVPLRKSIYNPKESAKSNLDMKNILANSPFNAKTNKRLQTSLGGSQLGK